MIGPFCIIPVYENGGDHPTPDETPAYYVIAAESQTRSHEWVSACVKSLDDTEWYAGRYFATPQAAFGSAVFRAGLRMPNE